MTSREKTENKGIKILIAEDSPTQAEQLRNLLEDQGYRVATAVNGRQALEAARKLQPTLIISDVVMPEMDGYELSRRVKADPSLGNIPIILVTTLSDPNDVIRGLECRADNFILKPYDEDYLLARVKFVLINREVRQTEQGNMGVEVFFNGQKHFITADRLQILNLLLSTYDAAIQRNKELNRSREELQLLNAKLEAANLAKDRFLATMSHELRTPMNAIIGFTGTLLMKLPGPLNAEQNKQLSTIQSSARHLLSLINDLLDLAKIEAGKVELKFETTDCKAVVEEVVTTLRPQAESKRLALQVTLPDQALTISADRRALSQIIINLANNAIKFTERGSVHLKVSPGEANGRRMVEFSVEDTGIGIRPEDQLKLFAAFTQVGQASRGREGTGLGLHLSQKLAELLGGKITFRSEYGKGSTFTLALKE
jgi:two-component system sensor histidine kinase/response regulator